MVTLAVAAVLLAIAVPSFDSMIATNRLATAGNDLLASLAQARTEAIRRGVRVTVCKSSNGTACATAGDWDQGWLVLVDTTRSGLSAAVDVGETVIATGGNAPTGISIQGSTDVVQYVSYGADGRAKLMSGSSQTGTIRLCATSSAVGDDRRARNLDISTTGRAEIRPVAGIDRSCPAP